MYVFIYDIHFIQLEITTGPCILIGSHWSKLFTNCIILCT